MTFNLTYVFIFFVRFGLLSGHRLEKKKLLARLIICSLCTLTICNFNYFPSRAGFGF